MQQTTQHGKTVDLKSSKKTSKEDTNTISSAITSVFMKSGYRPRPHQVRSIVKIVADLASFDHPKGKVRNYLIQQAAGSGKSLTIACLAYVLYKMKPGVGRRGFDTIIILNDRTYLDEQLFNTIHSFFKANNVNDVAQSESTDHLETLLGGKSNIRVIITTVQKFVLLKESIHKVNRIAIIADEAHRTHGSSSTDRLQQFLTGSVSQSTLITYFCFTCTPTDKTLQMFGSQCSASGKLIPFSVYSNEDAVRHGIILDVLTDFKHVNDYEKLEPDECIRQKVTYIINHFYSRSAELSNELYLTKAMLVVGSRLEILKYKKEFDLQVPNIALEREKQPFCALCTFTPFQPEPDGPTVSDRDPDVNGVYAPDVIGEFLNPKSPCKIIIVAEKLQTGFDAPILGIMYVDKTIKGANAVQTLGRLSRTAPGKKSVSIIDFKNDFLSITHAFQSFSNLAPPEATETDDMVYDDLHNHNSIIKMLINELSSAGGMSAKNFQHAWDKIWDKKNEVTAPVLSDSVRSRLATSEHINYTLTEGLLGEECDDEDAMRREYYANAVPNRTLDEPIMEDLDEKRAQFIQKPLPPVARGPKFVPRAPVGLEKKAGPRFVPSAKPSATPSPMRDATNSGMEVEKRRLSEKRENGWAFDEGVTVEEMVVESSTPLASSKTKRDALPAILTNNAVPMQKSFVPKQQEQSQIAKSSNVNAQAPWDDPSQTLNPARARLQQQREQQDQTEKDQLAERAEQLNELRELKEAQQSLIRERQRSKQLEKQGQEQHSHTKHLEREKQEKELQAANQQHKERENREKEEREKERAQKLKESREREEKERMQKESVVDNEQEKEREKEEKDQRDREHREKLLKENRERKEAEEREREQRQRELLAREGRLKERQVLSSSQQAKRLQNSNSLRNPLRNATYAEREIGDAELIEDPIELRLSMSVDAAQSRAKRQQDAHVTFSDQQLNEEGAEALEENGAANKDSNNSNNANDTSPATSASGRPQRAKRGSGSGGMTMSRFFRTVGQ